MHRSTVSDLWKDNNCYRTDHKKSVQMKRSEDNRGNHIIDLVSNTAEDKRAKLNGILKREKQSNDI